MKTVHAKTSKSTKTKKHPMTDAERRMLPQDSPDAMPPAGYTFLPAQTRDELDMIVDQLDVLAAALTGNSGVDADRAGRAAADMFSRLYDVRARLEGAIVPVRAEVQS